MISNAKWNEHTIIWFLHSHGNCEGNAFFFNIDCFEILIIIC